MIDALIEQGRFREAARALDALQQLSLTQQVQRAYVQSESEGSAAAAPRASELLKSRLHKRDRAICLTILATAAAYAGDVRTGLRHFDHARKLLYDDATALARMQQRLVQTLITCVGVEPALAQIPPLRRAVTKSGSGPAAVALHLLCAEIQIMRNHPLSAETHLNAAEDLLRSYPELTNEYRLLQLQSNRAALSCDFRHALELAERCLVIAEEAGRVAGVASSLLNIAHFSVVTGDLQRAQQALGNANRFPLSDPLGLCAAATEIDLHLAHDDLESAMGICESMEGAASDLEHGHSFYALWFTAGRVRCLIRSSRAAEAAIVALESLPYTDRFADKNLSAYMRLYAAEALIRSGDMARSHQQLAELLRHHLGVNHLAEMYRVKGLLPSKSEKTHVRAFDRAERMFRAVGLRTSETEVRANRAECSASDVPKATTQNSAAAARDVSESWLAILDSSNSADVIAHEVANIIQWSELGDDIEIIACSSDQTAAPEPQDDALKKVRITISGNRTATGRQIVLTPKNDTVSRLDLMAIQRGLHRIQADLSSRGQDMFGTLFDDAHAEFSGMIVVSESMLDVIRITQRVALSSVTVLITGESGTGKELLAQALHSASPRCSKPFIPFNCAAVSRELVGSQLFGYRRGAFTGAQDSFGGVIRAAAGGTLLLDEIGEVPLEVQPKLLRFLESGEIHPLGEPRPITVDVRVVAATNANLEQMVAEGRFREDLYYRLNVVRLQVPPLRDRREEIPPLVHHFLDRFSRESNKSGIRLADQTMEYLLLFNWPGNVRQLSNEIRRLVALAEPGAILMPEHLSREIGQSRRTIPASDGPDIPTEFVVRVDQPLSAAMAHVERSMVQYALATAGDRLEDAARMLGLSRKGLYLKRQRLNLDPTPGDKREKSASNAG